MFTAFCFFGLLPLAGFIGWVAAFGLEAAPDMAFVMACFVSVLTLFVLGFSKVCGGVPGQDTDVLQTSREGLLLLAVVAPSIGSGDCCWPCCSWLLRSVCAVARGCVVAW